MGARGPHQALDGEFTAWPCFWACFPFPLVLDL